MSASDTEPEDTDPDKRGSESSAPEPFEKWQREMARTLAPSLKALQEWQQSVARSIAPALEAIARNQHNIAATLAPTFERIGDIDRDTARALAPSLEKLGQAQTSLAHLIAPSVDALHKWQQQIGASLAQPLEAAAAWQAELQRIWTSTLVPLAKQFREYWLNALPTNWHELPPERIEDVVELMCESGLGLAWVPRAEIIQELMDAQDGTKRSNVLLSREKELLEDIDQELSKVTANELDDLKNAAILSMRAFEAGHDAASQALSAAALTEIVEGQFGRSLSGLRKKFENVAPMDMSLPLQALRLWALLVGVATAALAQFDRQVSIPHTFNRHASLHTIAPAQYTHENALSALLLVTSLLRELQENQSS